MSNNFIFSSILLESMSRLASTAKRWTHYGTLGVPFSASVKEIKSNFRQKSIECHPDKFPGDALKEAEFKVDFRSFSK